MATTGIGYRSVVSLVMEISLHLLQGIVYTTLTSPVTAGSNRTATIGSTVNFYTGAQIVFDLGNAGQEIITVTAVTSATTFIATFANAHAAGVVIQGATFPVQAPTDPIFTTSEVLGYVARAQNQFLMDIPCYFSRATQSVSTLINAMPATTLDLERIAVLTAGRYSRLYPTTQEELTAVDPGWRTRTITSLRSWAEDRAGLYGFAVNGNPSTTFTVETLAAQRDSDTLALTDGFLVPDLLVTYVKYKSLEFAYTKDGEFRNPLLAQYCGMRYQRGVMAAQRWLSAMGVMPAQSASSRGGA